MNEYKEECNCYGCTTMRHECIHETYENDEEVRNDMLEAYIGWIQTDINTTIKEKHNEERLESIGR
tara:strand:+ start:2395 stop:2592 length:198 start_codon:yes stop_codon:yes gene_type:complete